MRWFALRNDWKEQKKRLLKTITQVRPAAPSQRTNDALLKASVSRAFAELPKDNPLKMLRPIGQCWVFSVCLLNARILKHDQTSVPLLEKVELLHEAALHALEISQTIKQLMKDEEFKIFPMSLASFADLPNRLLAFGNSANVHVEVLGKTKYKEESCTEALCS